MGHAMLGIEPGVWPAVNALLDQAMDLPPDSRRAWLEGLPPESAQHRPVLMRLLAANGGGETNALFARLPRAAMEALAADRGDEALAAGTSVGPYVLLAQIGRGGMGSAWLAERLDGQPKRKVALKLPHLGWAPGLAERVERERERDILASLAHPNIARLYDAGVDAIGRPYLALEYVEGTPIDRYADAKQLGVRARLALVLQIAAAVAHAHAQLAVHRDLKPSNILVTPNAEVRLLDFGIAKLLQEGSATDDTASTREHGRALTPEYASPEQIRGERVGTASDVYSLGVVAYELLAGVRPYRIEGSDAAALQAAGAVDGVALPLASRSATDALRQRELEGDLDAILGKALKRDPAERYATVLAFADDIQRYLANAPVRARPDTLAYRLRKFVTRHAWQVGAGGLVLLAVAAGTGTSLWQARAARLQAARAETEAARAEQVKRFTLSIFEDADTDAGAGAATTAVDLLKQATARAERELGNRPDVQVEILTSIAYSLRGQGRAEDSAAVSAKALALGRESLGADHPLTLAAAVVTGRALDDLGRAGEAAPILTATIADARRLGLQHPLSAALQVLSSLQLDKGDAAGAIAAARESTVVVTANAAAFSSLETANAWLNLADVLRAARAEGGLDAAQRGLALMQQIYGDRPTLSLLSARVLVANGKVEAGQMRAGVDDLTEIVVAARQLLGLSHPKLAFFLKYLGDARFDAGDYGGAVEATQAALEIAQAGRSGGLQSVVTIEPALVNSLVGAGLAQQAVAHADAGLDVAAKIKDADLGKLRELAAARATALAGAGQLGEAERTLGGLLAQSAVAGKERALIEGRAAELRNLQGRHEEAVRLAEASQRVLGADRSAKLRADAERVLGQSLLAAHRGSEAVGPLQKALDLYRLHQIVVSPEQAATLRDLARAKTSIVVKGVPQ